jgi:hypothetical protein
VLVLTTFELDEYVFEALAAGASGFLLKNTDPMELLRAVRVVAEGDALLAPSVTRRLIAEFAAARRQASAPAAAVDLAALTEREREVMALAGAGLSNEEIAERPTRRSPSGWWSARPRPGPTSAGPWSSSAPATGPSWSSSPTSPAWSAPATPAELRPPP